MDVTLTPDLERRIAEKVDAGLYATPGEAVREGLRLLFNADPAPEARMARLDAEIDSGLMELDRGEGLPGESVYEALKTKIAKLRQRWAPTRYRPAREPIWKTSPTTLLSTVRTPPIACSTR